MDLNLTGCLHGIRSITPMMLQAKTPGCIVNTASVGGLLNPGGGGLPYVVAKHGVTLVTESLANDLRRAQASITAHVLCPNRVATNFGTNMAKTADVSLT